MERPGASAAIMAARCEIDLSPGSFSLPETRSLRLSFILATFPVNLWDSLLVLIDLASGYVIKLPQGQSVPGKFPLQ